MNIEFITEKDIRNTVPNILATTEGETSIFDKLTPFLEASARWIWDNIVSNTYFWFIANDTEGDFKTHEHLKRIIIYDAMMRAIPSLDIILTPNGFGIVSNSNIAPASKERVERLITSMETQRDNALETFLQLIYYDIEDWTTSEQGQFFTATLFQNITLCNRLGITEHRWREYNRIRSKLIAIETKLAENYFSKEQMQEFRNNVAAHMDGVYSSVGDVITAIQSLELAILNGEQPHPQTARDIVNVIRLNPDDFPFWHDSATAKLFTPPIFSNKKSAGGYWF